MVQTSRPGADTDGGGTRLGVCERVGEAPRDKTHALERPRPFALNHQTVGPPLPPGLAFLGSRVYCGQMAVEEPRGEPQPSSWSNPPSLHLSSPELLPAPAPPLPMGAAFDMAVWQSVVKPPSAAVRVLWVPFRGTARAVL
uniref:Uncharacterized protein n=1 Tax=Eutreptiella gymnastica TaxID=73025 RepID=A0A7S4FG16_9EUGL